MTRALLAIAAFAFAGLALAAEDGANLDWIAAAANEEVRLQHIPGAVVLVGTSAGVIYRRAFGYRTLRPRPVPMDEDTVFDLASLTKVVATTPAVLKLVEEGRLRLDAPASIYWPQFGRRGKQAITIRQLLLHYSGLRAGLDLRTPWSGYEAAMQRIVDERPAAAPGSRYLYSDINFVVLGEIVRRVSGMPLDEYCRTRIFEPLGMRATSYRPAFDRARIAPTQDLPGAVHWGEVHDAMARWMGGVAGNAGVFSTVDDLARFARMVLTGGGPLLSPATVSEMLANSAPGARAHALGWELGGPQGLALFPEGTLGHLGYTGTLIWIDPRRDLFAVVLTNRVYPDGKGDAAPLRRAIIDGLSNPERPLRQAEAGTPR